MKKIGIFLAFVIFSNLLNAQDHIIHGIVHTFDKIPLIGAEIKVKSTKQSVFTDSLGNFVVLCNSEDKLRVMARGFYTQNVKIDGSTKVVAVNLNLKPGDKQREYAIGYGYVSGEDLTNAVAGLNTTDASFLKYSDIYSLIRDQVDGVQIKNGEIIIRGDRSFQGSSAALIVVDGIIWDSETLSTLSPIQVKSIDAIKDGGAAVYGSRGANGVILIETIKGGEEVK
ncbi:MAG: carboxypeptidase-like regulatory domain-containing protein [Bacteroidota bacterium]